MKYKVRLNGKVYEVEVEKGKAQLLDEYEAVSTPAAVQAAPVVQAAAAPTAQPQAQAQASGNAIGSPLPGAVVDIKVTVGQQVKHGDLVMIIEAMKMENEITAAKDGKITAILVNKGAKVQEGTPIYEIG